MDDTLDAVDHIDKIFTQLNAQKNVPTRSMKEVMDAKKQLVDEEED